MVSCATASDIYSNLVLYFIDFGISSYRDYQHTTLGLVGKTPEYDKGSHGYRSQDVVKLTSYVLDMYTFKYHDKKFICSVFDDRCSMVTTIIELLMGITFWQLNVNASKPGQKFSLWQEFRKQSRYKSLPEMMIHHEQRMCPYKSTVHNDVCVKLMTRFPYYSSHRQNIWKLLYALCNHENISQNCEFFLRLIPDQ